ncbi:MAG: pseudouridine synthase, partial [Acholeplasmatales bacterium]|nr:pseudouridine synthase [Acholeplasmatales bacterium]
MKLGKYLAHGGIASRRKSKELILNGKVLVNGEVVTEPSYLVKKDDVVTYKDEVVEKEELVYYLVNKPRGVVSTVKDEKGRKTILDLLNDEDKDERVYPVGRLDYDSTGVLILTNDGELAYILTRPEYEVPKTYLVTAKGIITREAERKLRTGIELDGYRTREAKVSVKEKNNQKKTSLVEITITEGKNH